MTREDGLLLGVDIGTTSLKIALFDADANLVGDATSEYPTYHPRLEEAEHDPDTWWRAFKKCLQTILSSRVVNSKRILALAISELAPVVVPVDRKGRALRPAMIWMDRRCCRGQMTQDPVAKQLWISETEPRVFEKTHNFLNASGFLYRHLTGEFATYENLRVPEDLAEKQPRRYLPGQVVGHVIAEAAQETGLAEGTPAVMGFYDSMCTVLGSGVVRPGRAVDMTGHSTVVMVCTDRRLNVPYCVPHVVPGLWLLALSTSAGGGMLRWFNEQFEYERISSKKGEFASSYERMDADASRIEPGADGLIMLPYLEGRGQENASPKFDASARGTIFGITTAHTPAHFVRMFLEANAYETRLNLEAVEKQGVKVTELRAADAGSKSNLWLQIKADVFGKTVSRLTSSSVATPFGDALIAGVGVGIYEDLAWVSDHFAKVDRVFEPHSDRHELYSRIYSKYLDLDRRLCDMDRDVSEKDKDSTLHLRGRD